MKMTTKSNKYKTKKSGVGTSPSEAPVQDETEVDLSHIRQPISTSIFGLHQVLQLIKTGTDEVKSYITYECDILFECRMCRTIFRSLANFILHKRTYCTKNFSVSDMPDCQNPGITVVEDDEVSNSDSNVVSPEHNVGEAKKCTKKSISPIIEKLVQKQEISNHVMNVLNEDLTLKIEDKPEALSQENCILLQKIDTSHSAVFQTFAKASQQLTDPNLMKSEVMEIHGIFEPNEVVLSSDGKICDFKRDEKDEKSIVIKHDVVCTECNAKFATKKTLTSHIKYKHNKTCLVYPCPDCKETYANPWSVYRHLYKVHRRTSAQVRRMRSQIHSSAIRREQELNLKKDNTPLHSPESNEENQWVNNFEEDNDLQMCGGCGKRFERKAALHSHSQMCSKRMEIQNIITKTKLTGTKSKPLEEEKTDQRNILKGAAKRKYRVLESFKSHSVETASSRKRFKEINRNNNNAVFKENSSDIVQKTKLQPTDAGTLVKITNSTNSIDIDIKTIDYPIKEKSETTVKEKLVMVPEVGPEISVYIKTDCDEPLKDSQYALKTAVATQAKEHCIPVSNVDEIYDISDDSCEFVQENLTLKENQDIDEKESSNILKPQKVSCYIRSAGKDQPRKRAVSCDWRTNAKTSPKSLDTMQYINKHSDESFIMKASPYMKKNELKCLSCQTTYASLYQLLWHMSLHFSWYRFQCTKCSFMSFNKYDCKTHAFKTHGTPNNLIESTVLPIPKWKIIYMSHDFTMLDKNELVNRNLPKAVIRTEVDKANIEARDGQWCLSYEKEHLEVTNSDKVVAPNLNFSCSKINLLQTSSLENNVKPPTLPDVDLLESVLVVDDDDEVDTSVQKTVVLGSNTAETIIHLDNDSKLNHSNEGSNGESLQPGPSRTLGESNRPIRNRTKSVKTVQSDFLYDLTKVLKLNDSSIKSSSNKSRKSGIKKGT